MTVSTGSSWVIIMHEFWDAFWSYALREVICGVGVCWNRWGVRRSVEGRSPASDGTTYCSRLETCWSLDLLYPSPGATSLSPSI